MTINERLTTFAGLPVVDFEPGEGGEDREGGGPAEGPGQGDRAAVAWRVAENDFDESEDQASPKFLA